MNDYERIERAIAYLESHYRNQPSVGEVAAHVGLSESRFHRVFQQWAGITPKRFLAYVTAAHARGLLEESATVLDAAWSSGLSGSGRLHDLFVNLEGVTPGEIRRRGQDLVMRYGVHESPFGTCLLVETDRGVNHLSFIDEDDPDRAVESWQSRWPHARLVRDAPATESTLAGILASLEGKNDDRPRLHVGGTNFQVRVWEALLNIPPGRVASYEQVAAWAGRPNAVRAVGSAVGANPVPLLIPCHRVIRKSGAFGGYSGGLLRKRAIIAWESAHAPTQRSSKAS